MNKDYYIVVDASCDFPKDDIIKNNIKVIPMDYSLNDVMLKNDCLLDESKLLDLYNAQRNNDLTKTSQITPAIYTEFFKKLLDEGKSVLYICLSSGLSGTYNSSLIASKNLNDEYKDKGVKVMPLDSLQATCGENLIIESAVENYNKGIELEENYSFLQEAIKHIHTFFAVEDLDYLKRGGRISSLSASVGKLLKIKPILKIDEIGKLQTISKQHGEKKAVEYIYNQFKENSDSERTKSIWIVHSDAPTKLEFLIELIKADFKDIQIHVTLESPIIASHTGPDFIALTGYGK